MAISWRYNFFMLADISLNVVPVPSGITSNLSNLVIIFRGTVLVDHVVDAAAPSQNLPAIVRKGAPVEPVLRCNSIIPVVRSIGRECWCQERNHARHDALVAYTCFEDKDRSSRIFRKSTCNYISGISSSNDDIVVGMPR